GASVTVRPEGGAGPVAGAVVAVVSGVVGGAAAAVRGGVCAKALAANAQPISARRRKPCGLGRFTSGFVTRLLVWVDGTGGPGLREDRTSMNAGEATSVYGAHAMH